MTRLSCIAGTALVILMTVLFCLIPKPENDLFFILRIGADILHTGRVPHFDTYSWSNYGTHWDLPEWLAFVLYALAFRAGSFGGTWLLMTLLTVAATLLVWRRLVRCVGIPAAFTLITLMLTTISGLIQERPYVFSYLLLAGSLEIVLRARETRLRSLLWLLPLCALWANLHQGVLALIGLLLIYALGDALPTLWGQGQSRLAAIMLGMAAGCALMAMISPYGEHLYSNVWLTVGNRTLMANVTEWNSAAVLPPVQLEPLIALALVAFGGLALSPQRNLSDAMALAALLGQALLHARNIPLFAIGGLMIAAPPLGLAARQIRRQLGLAPEPTPRPVLFGVFAILFVTAVALVSITSLKKAMRSSGETPGGIGEAVARVSTYPDGACAFMDREGFPPDLRLLNGFETGGFLMWRRPGQRVFIDGRLDVYVGQTFDDTLILSRSPGSATWSALVKRYAFDCVLTTVGPEARAFAADPNWQVVYVDPAATRRLHPKRYCILLRRRPSFTALVARCLREETILGKTRLSL